MKNKVIWFTTPKRSIQTKQVFAKNNQVFLKGVLDETFSNENENESWYPINFQWIPVIELRESLKK